ncbi:hypothetical protein GCM10027598_08570 [Amycolatopsis oliviviridis]|uniref:Uncharacterized protein n=1 Tax=Amycolatopsis oliviviridis TaxID=1471590 RepID=A0ABQ3LP18_9PSEU|nr:hypothetical protein GCM10017790_41980 [Amycolatopsis oliviviridis]
MLPHISARNIARDMDVDEFAAWAAPRHQRLSLGRTAAEVRAGMEKVIRDAKRAPVKVGEDTLYERTIPFVYYVASSDDRENEQFAATVRALKGMELPSNWLLGITKFLNHPGLSGIENSGSAQSSLMLALVCGDTPALRGSRGQPLPPGRHAARPGHGLRAMILTSI